MWDLPGPGLERLSPALAGGFLTTVPPGKPLIVIFTFVNNSKHLMITSVFIMPSHHVGH